MGKHTKLKVLCERHFTNKKSISLFPVCCFQRALKHRCRTCLRLFLGLKTIVTTTGSQVRVDRQFISMDILNPCNRKLSGTNHWGIGVDIVRVLNRKNISGFSSFCTSVLSVIFCCRTVPERSYCSATFYETRLLAFASHQRKATPLVSVGTCTESKLWFCPDCRENTNDETSMAGIKGSREVL